MPTAYTKIVDKLRYAVLMRKNALQKAAADMPMAWESVPVLEHIRQNSGCMQADIAKKLNITAAAVTLSTQKLENAGLIRKEIDSDNLRCKKMYITADGERALRRGTEIFDKTDTAMFADITDEEVSNLNEILDKIAGNLEASDQSGNCAKKRLTWEFSEK